MTDSPSSRVKLAMGSLGFLALILVANVVTSRFGMIPVGFGLVATAGTYTAGATFVVRDFVHDHGGRLWVVVLVLIGAVLSLLLSNPHIAIASGVAFLLSELADLAVYAPLRKRGYVRAAVASNIVGSLVDTVAFLAIAGFPIIAALPGQMVGKLAVTLVMVVLVALVRLLAVRDVQSERQPA